MSRSIEPGGTLHRFARLAANQPDAPALVIGDQQWTYRELDTLARSWASALVSERQGPPPRVGIFASRSVEAYAGILASMYAGAPYVPFQYSHPKERLLVMARLAEIDAIVLDLQSIAAFTELIDELPEDLVVLAPGGADSRPDQFNGTWLSMEELGDPADLSAPTPGHDELAYLLFTSGTTGIPKAVAVSHGNVEAFIDAVMQRFPFAPEDRFSQTYDLTFDPSVFDMFVAWSCGGSLHVPRQLELIAPARFIAKHEITVWSSVPTLISMMRRKNSLEPGRFSHVRYSMFCGEGLPVVSTEAWAEAAPASVIENLYGPTEATVVCVGYTWSADADESLFVDGKLPIGTAFPGVSALIVDADLKPVPPGQDGELCIGGDQTALGYWQDDAKTDKAFVTLQPDDQQPPVRYYRTGDLARELPNGDIACLGRIDDQVKILGRRVELGEIDGRVVKMDGVVDAVALGWPLDDEGRAQSVAVVVTGAAPAVDDVREKLSVSLPDYMLPSRILAVDEMPLNVNGKVDRKALMARLAASQ